jgi:hypothetical protein
MSIHEAEVDRLLNERDLTWCLALLTVEPHLGVDMIAVITKKFIDLRSRQEEVLAALDQGSVLRTINTKIEGVEA